MPFSLRFTADLLIAITCRAVRRENAGPLVSTISLGSGSAISPEESGSGSLPSEVHGLKKVVSLSRWQSPVVWIGGFEPLEHPDAPRIANALTTRQHHVFLETSGALLKARAHDLHPSSHLYLVVRFDQIGKSAKSANESPCRIGIEALRFARLCGFLTCARFVLGSTTNSADVERLHAQVKALDVDGALISASVAAPQSAAVVRELRGRLLTRRWALFSRLLDASSQSAAGASAPDQATNLMIPGPRPDEFGEEARAG